MSLTRERATPETTLITQETYLHSETTLIYLWFLPPLSLTCLLHPEAQTLVFCLAEDGYISLNLAVSLSFLFLVNLYVCVYNHICLFGFFFLLSF